MSLLSYCNDESVIEQNNLYSFSDNYKMALLSWFYTNQDTVTGYWGPMSGKNGRLIKIDLNNTASIIKTFIDKNGDNIHPSFPLRYKDKIFATTLDLLQKSLPDQDALDEWHAWDLSMNKGLKILL
jgi:hypothetical protein